MPYTIPATSKTPFLIIYLLDVSGSMSQQFKNISKIDAVSQALQKVAIRMIQRSTKGAMVAPRYRIAMFAYSSQVIDLLGGIKTIDDLAKMGVPQMTTLDMTDTAAAFRAAENLLKNEIPKMKDQPAPMICHVTDGEYNGEDPLPIVKRIMNMSVPDGNVLVENIFVGDLLTEPIYDTYNWKGVTQQTQFANQYGQHLAEMSSPFPEAYSRVMQEMGYRLAPDALMMIPAHNPELVELGFAMSGATPVTTFPIGI